VFLIISVYFHWYSRFLCWIDVSLVGFLYTFGFGECYRLGNCTDPGDEEEDVLSPYKVSFITLIYRYLRYLFASYLFIICPFVAVHLVSSSVLLSWLSSHG
jgi:hypothetical protein